MFRGARPRNRRQITSNLSEIGMNPIQLELLDHEYGGEIIRQRASDGFINATAMCRAAKREWPEYRRRKSTDQFFNALALDLGISQAQLSISNLGSPGGDRRNQGTWVHPQIAIDLAQWLSPEFKIRVTRWVMDWMSGLGSPVSARRGYIPDFVDRYLLNQKQVPPGYFSVISELFVVAYALLEQEGYVLPEKGAHGRNVSPDISVGLHFSTWLKKNYPALADRYVKYTHVFRDGRRIDRVRAYPNSMLGMFRDFVINVWMRDHAPKYFKRVDPPAVPFLETILAALPPPADYPALSAPE